MFITNLYINFPSFDEKLLVNTTLYFGKKFDNNYMNKIRLTSNF